MKWKRFLNRLYAPQFKCEVFVKSTVLSMVLLKPIWRQKHFWDFWLAEFDVSGNQFLCTEISWRWEKLLCAIVD